MTSPPFFDKMHLSMVWEGFEPSSRKANVFRAHSVYQIPAPDQMIGRLSDRRVASALIPRPQPDCSPLRLGASIGGGIVVTSFMHNLYHA